MNNRELITKKAVPIERLGVGYIYVLLNEGEIVYIGMSMYDPIGRILSHIRGGKVFDSYSILTGEDFGVQDGLFRYHVDYVEAVLIMEYSPKYNASISNKYFVTSTWIKNRYKRRINLVNKDIKANSLKEYWLDGYIYYSRDAVEKMYNRERNDRE